VPNLKSVALIVFELLAFNAEKFRGSRDPGHAPKFFGVMSELSLGTLVPNFRYRCAFCSKNRNIFLTPDYQASKTEKIDTFGADSKNRSVSPLAFIAVSKVNTAYSSSESRKSVTVNSQIGVTDSKYVVVFDPVPIGHMTRGMRWPLTWAERYFCG